MAHSVCDSTYDMVETNTFVHQHRTHNHTHSPSITVVSMVVCAELDAHDGRLPAKSLQSDRFRSRLSSVEKLLRDDSQLRFWLRLFEWKFVTTPLDELLLAYEFRR